LYFSDVEWNVESNLSGTKVHLLYDVPVSTEAGKYLKKNSMEYDNTKPAKLTGPCIVEIRSIPEFIGKEAHISIYAARAS
jgi:hypothetical protein